MKKRRLNFIVDGFLYQQIKFIATCKHKTMTDYVIDLIKKDLESM